MASSEPTRSRGSKGTTEGHGPNQDLNRGFRYDEYGDPQGQT